MFVEAEANSNIEDIGDMTKTDPNTLGKLVYNVPGAGNFLQNPLMTVQVISLYFVNTLAKRRIQIILH